MGFSFLLFFLFSLSLLLLYYISAPYMMRAGPRTRRRAHTHLSATRTPTTNTRVQRIRRQINNKKLDNHIQNSTYKKVSSIYSRFSSQKQRRSTRSHLCCKLRLAAGEKFYLAVLIGGNAERTTRGLTSSLCRACILLSWKLQQ